MLELSVLSLLITGVLTEYISVKYLTAQETMAFFLPSWNAHIQIYIAYE